MQHVPYRGMPQALTDVLSGEIDCVFADPASAQGLVQDGRLRVLAVTSNERLAPMPNAPTLAEAGLPGSDLTAWVGVFVRAGTSADVIARLNELTTAFVTREETKAYLESVGAKPFRATPEELGAFQEADTKRWAEIVAIAKIEKK
jgi:tripartite-type tricarboxylate transporter receptor subunit TctC